MTFAKRLSAILCRPDFFSASHHPPRTGTWSICSFAKPRLPQPFPLEDSMDDLKYAILVAATILAARKLNEIGSNPCPAPDCTVSDAISIQPRTDSQGLTNAGLRPKAVTQIEFWISTASDRLRHSKFACLSPRHRLSPG